MKSALMLSRFILAMMIVAGATALGQNSPTAGDVNSVAPQPEEKAAAYLRTISERSEKIVVTLGIADSGRSNRVHGIIVQQYRGLNDIQFVRDLKIQNAKAPAHIIVAQQDRGVNDVQSVSVRDVKIQNAKTAADNAKSTSDAAIQAARDETKPKLDKLHTEFLAKLSAELSPDQEDKVKDGMTYGVVHVTYNVYLKMYPDLTDAQKKQIMAWLVEARELAMDQGTSNEKHAVFGKYKGRINNYLSKAGYDAKKGEQNLKKAGPAELKTKAPSA